MKVQTVRRIVTGCCLCYALVGWVSIFTLIGMQSWPWWAEGLAAFAGIFTWSWITLGVRRAVLKIGQWT